MYLELTAWPALDASNDLQLDWTRALQLPKAAARLFRRANFNGDWFASVLGFDEVDEGVRTV